MCGFLICSNRVTSAAFEHAAKLIDHRGIRTKVMEGSRGWVAHARLPIVGLGEENDQPVRRIAHGRESLIAFVGEVLDFREGRGGTDCDLQTVTRAWATRGPYGLTGHDGFWSVGVLDGHGEIHVFCDYLAQKPTYYRTDARAASSELAPLAALWPVTPDEIYLSAVVKWGYCPDLRRTPYAEISHVLPGEHVRMPLEGGAYTTITDALKPMANHDDLKYEIQAAVRRRVLSADVPVAALVSGGLDSSIVYMLAARHGSVEPYYVSDVVADDEELFAVGAVLGNDTKKLLATKWSDVREDYALHVMQEPIDLGSLLPQVALSKIVKERVCLTGDGADEAFGGYGRSMRYDSQQSDLFHELPAWHLPRLDRVMMRERIEVRSPFLARRVVQTALGLPWSMRQDKSFLRHIFKDDLPPTIAQRKKKPLRTTTVDQDREGTSARLVGMFRRTHWPDVSKQPA